MAQKQWTRGEIEEMLRNNPRAVERAMTALLTRQTDDERRDADAKHQNGQGFAACTSRRGTYFARWVSSGRNLTGEHLNKARKIALYHAGQLTDIANKVR